MKRYWKVMCDECGVIFPKTFEVEEGASTEAALAELREAGWLRLTEDGTNRDLCPDCAKDVPVIVVV